MSKEDLTTRLRRVIHHNGGTQAQLARYLVLDHSTIANWCRGYSSPAVHWVIQMSEYYELTVGQIVGTEELPEEYNNDNKSNS